MNSMVISSKEQLRLMDVSDRTIAIRERLKGLSFFRATSQASSLGIIYVWVTSESEVESLKPMIKQMAHPYSVEYRIYE
jgi:hypothetical protein